MYRPQANQIKLFFSKLLLASSAILYPTIGAAQTAPPPNLGQDTKGQPAAKETLEQASNTSDTDPIKTPTKNTVASVKNPGPLGSATITESRRENGQVYLIEFEHSSGSKQYLEETDSDGNIQSRSKGLDETPNIPKWKLGSW